MRYVARGPRRPYDPSKPCHIIWNRCGYCAACKSSTRIFTSIIK